MSEWTAESAIEYIDSNIEQVQARTNKATDSTTGSVASWASYVGRTLTGGRTQREIQSRVVNGNNLYSKMAWIKNQCKDETQKSDAEFSSILQTEMTQLKEEVTEFLASHKRF